MFKKVIILVILNFILFFTIGSFMYEKRPEYRDKLQPFFDSLQNEKVGLYYLNLKFLEKNHDYLKIKIVSPTGTVEDVCYEILENKLKKTQNCQNDIEIILDEHAISTIMSSSYTMKNILFSEFLFGHIKFNGLKMQDVLGVLK